MLRPIALSTKIVYSTCLGSVKIDLDKAEKAVANLEIISTQIFSHWRQVCRFRC